MTVGQRQPVKNDGAWYHVFAAKHYGSEWQEGAIIVGRSVEELTSITR